MDPLDQPAPADSAAERIICVVARDVLSLERQPHESSALGTALRKGWVLIAGCVMGFTAVAVAYALLAAEWYTADVVLIPAAAKNTQGLTSQVEGLGMLAGLAGLNLGSGRTSEPIGVLKSREFAGQFIEEQGLLHVLLADKWDARLGRWKQVDPKRQPDLRDAILYFDVQVLRVEEDKRTGLFTVSVTWRDPAVAAAWANAIVARLNAQMRARALTDGEANIAYLQKELAATNIVGVEQAVSRLLESEMSKLMMARGDPQFAFRVVDRAQVPKWRSWPKRKVIVALGFLMGGIAGVGAAIARESLASRSRGVVG